VKSPDAPGDHDDRIWVAQASNGRSEMRLVMLKLSPDPEAEFPAVYYDVAGGKPQ